MKILIWLTVAWIYLMGVMGISQSSLEQYSNFYTRPGEDLKAKTAKNLFIKVSLDKQKAYEGECIVATYNLYVALDIQGKITKAPSYAGFASYDVFSNQSDSYTTELINGTPFKKYLIKQVQLFALQPGLQRLEPVELESTVRFLKIDASGNMEYVAYPSQPKDTLFPYILKSEPVIVDILPLPNTAITPAASAVGAFAIDVMLDKTNLAPQQTGYLTITLRGYGNWHDVTSPTLNWPSQFEVFEPKVTEDLRPQYTPIQGKKTYRYPFTIAQNGTYQLPAAQFTFFDLENKKYITVNSKSTTITVTGSPYKAPNSAQFLKKRSTDFTELFSKVVLVVFPIAAIILIGILWVRKKKSNVPEKNSMQKVASYTDNNVKRNAPIKQHTDSKRQTIEEIRQDARIWIGNETGAFVDHPNQLTNLAETPVWKEEVSYIIDTANRLLYGPLPTVQETEQLDAAWKLFKRKYSKGSSKNL